jgi:hypothetical protein
MRYGLTHTDFTAPLILQMGDWGDLSYLVKRNYEAGFRQLMQHALPVPADRLDPQQPGFLQVLLHSINGDSNVQQQSANCSWCRCTAREL